MLSLYERASCQSLNRQKISILFSSNTKGEARNLIQKEARVKECSNLERYLGLPAMVGLSRYNSFKYFKERVWTRVNSWKNTFLSQAGKQVLLKAVVQALPTYPMSIFRLLKKLCKDMTSAMSTFWWGHMLNDRKIPWRNWA